MLHHELGIVSLAADSMVVLCVRVDQAIDVARVPNEFPLLLRERQPERHCKVCRLKVGLAGFQFVRDYRRSAVQEVSEALRELLQVLLVAGGVRARLGWLGRCRAARKVWWFAFALLLVMVCGLARA